MHFHNANQGSRVHKPISIHVQLRHSYLMTVTALLSVRHSTFQLIAISAPLLFSVRHQKGRLSRQVQVQVTTTYVVRTVNQMHRTHKVIHVRAQLIQKHNISQRVNIHIALCTIVSVLANIRINNVLIVHFLHKFRIMFRHMYRIISRELRRYSHRFLHTHIVHRNMVSVLDRKSRLTKDVLNGSLMNTVHGLSVTKRHILRNRLNMYKYNNLTLLGLIRSNVRLQDIHNNLMVPNIFVSISAVFMTHYLQGVTKRHIRRLILIALSQKKVDAKGGASKVRHNTAVFRFLNDFSNLVYRFALRTAEQYEQAVHRGSGSLLHVNSDADATRRLSHGVRSVINSNNTDNFRFTSFILRAIRVHDRVTGSLKMIMNMPAASMHIVPSFILFVTNRLRRSSAGQFKAKLHALVNLHHTVGRTTRHNLRHSWPLNPVHLARQVIRQAKRIRRRHRISQLNNNSHNTISNTLRVRIRNMATVVILLSTLVLLQDTRLGANLILHGQLHPVYSHGQLDKRHG